MSLWEDVKSNMAELYSVTSEKTSELARISTRRYDKFGISREIERQFSELGNFVYMGLKEDKENILTDEVALDLVERLKVLEAELQDKDREIDDIKKQYSDRQSGSNEPEGDEPENPDTKESDEGGVAAAATMITDPVLGNGQSESAILVEPSPDEEEVREDPEP